MNEKEKLLFEMMEDLEDYLKEGCYHCNDDKHERFNDYEEKVKELFGFDFEEEQHKEFKRKQEELIEKRKDMLVEIPRPIK